MMAVVMVLMLVVMAVVMAVMGRKWGDQGSGLVFVSLFPCVGSADV